MEGAHDELETQNDPKDEDLGEVEEIEAEKDCEALSWSSRILNTIEKRWLQKTIFRSIGTIHGKKCIVVIDGGSCENIISKLLLIA